MRRLALFAASAFLRRLGILSSAALTAWFACGTLLAASRMAASNAVPAILRTAFLLCLLFSGAAHATPKKVLFLGNSFTYHGWDQDVPTEFRNAAAGGGFETPITDYNAPGGYTLYGHAFDSTSQAKIAQGGWDYVVIQQQSGTPPYAAVYESERESFFDAASMLYDQVKAASPNAVVILYETWAWSEGRIISENNSAWGPDAATMQARISLAYHNLAADLIASGRTDVEIAHVGDAREINRLNWNLNMFSDASHQNRSGAYLAGLVMYSTIYNANPIGNTHAGGQSATNMAYIQKVARFVADVPQPDAPERVFAAVDNSQVALTWYAADKATSYSVKRATVSGGPYTTLASGLTSRSYLDAGLTNGVTYYYVISGTNASGESPDSFEVVCTPLNTAPPPSGLAATSTGTQSVLSWSASAGATSYSVYRSTDGLSWTTMATGITATTYAATGSADQHYYFGVTTDSGTGSSSRSIVETDTIPAAPVLNSIATVGTQATLAWTGGAGTTFNIKRAASAAGPFATIATGVDATTYVDTGLTAGGHYYYAVTAANAAGESAASVVKKAGWGSGVIGEYYATSDHTGPIVVTRTDAQIGFSWPASTAPANGLPTENYSVRWTGVLQAPSSETYTFSASGWDSVRLYLDGVLLVTNGTVSKALTAGRKYTIVVEQQVATDGGSAALWWSTGTSDWEIVPSSYLYPIAATAGLATASGGGGAEGPASAFDGLTSTKWYHAEVGGTGWLKYQFSGNGEVVTGYSLTSANDVQQRDPAAWDFQGSTDGSTWTTLDTQSGQTFASRFQKNTYLISNTTAYRYYRLNVTANSGGSTYGIQLAELELVMPALATPGGLTASAGNQQIALAWNPVAGADSYQIKRATSSGGTYTNIATGVGASAWLDTGLTNGMTYYYVVTPVRAGKLGTGNAPFSATPAAPATAPEAPTGVVVNAGNAQISLNWNAVSGATSYIIKRSATNGGPYTVVAASVSGTGFVDTGLGAGTLSYYIVSAVNAGVESAASAEVFGTASVAPPAPAEFMAAAGNAQVDLSWSVSSGAASYVLKRATASGGPYTTVATGLTTTSYTDTGLTPGVHYYYTVAGINDVGPGTASEASATPNAAPLMIDLTATADSGRVNLSWTASGAASFTIKRSLASGGPYTTIGSATSLSYTDTAVVGGLTYYYVVSATNSFGSSSDSAQVSASPTGPVQIVSLKFDESSGTIAADSSGNGRNGTLVGGPTWVSGRLANAVNLSGSTQYVTLPTGAVNGLTDFTIATWVNLSSVSNWARIFDFGSGTSTYMFLSPKNGANGRLRFAIKNGGGEQIIDGTAALPTGSWQHVAVTLNGSTGTLYVNGAQVGQNTGMTLNPSSLGSTTLNYIGKSQFNDPYLAGAVDDFRIIGQALTAQQIAALAAPPAAPAPVTAGPGDAQALLNWSAVAGATSYNIKRATASGGPYAFVANTTGTSFTDTGLSNGTTYYYVVTALNAMTESAGSAEASTTPKTALQLWRQTNFGTADNTGDAADDADPDGDGWSNSHEFAAGTDPKDRASLLKVSQMETSGNDVVIGFSSVAGKTYRLECSDSLGSGSWVPVQENILGTGGVVQVTDPNGAGKTKRFYRLAPVP